MYVKQYLIYDHIISTGLRADTHTNVCIRSLHMWISMRQHVEACAHMSLIEVLGSPVPSLLLRCILCKVALIGPAKWRCICYNLLMFCLVCLGLVMFSVEVVWFFGFHSHRMLSGACVCVSVRLQEKSDRDSEHTRRRYRHSRKTSTPTHMSHAHTNKKATKGKNRRELGEVSFRILWTSLDWVFQPMVPLPGPPGRRCQRHKKPSGLAAAHLWNLPSVKLT